MSDLSHAKIAFPPPPPTCNTLTAAQRNHLLKSTKKVGQILGATPQVLDETQPLGSLHVQLHFGTIRAHNTHSARQHRRGSLDSISSGCSSFESTSSVISPIISGRTSPSFDYYSDSSSDSWRLRHAKKRPPLLSLSRDTLVKAESVLLDPITPTSASTPTSPLEELRFALSVPTRESRSSLYAEAPTFSIPSATTVRREKMQRVKRKLGDGVPLGLVFPSPPETEPSHQYPPKPLATTAAVPTTSTPSSPVDTQPRLTVHYAAAANSARDRSESNGEWNALGPIMESVDELRTPSTHSHDRDTASSKFRWRADEEVDVDLDKMLLGLAAQLGLRRRARHVAVSDFEMVTV